MAVIDSGFESRFLSLKYIDPNPDQKLLNPVHIDTEPDPQISPIPSSSPETKEIFG